MSEVPPTGVLNPKSQTPSLQSKSPFAHGLSKIKGVDSVKEKHKTTPTPLGLPYDPRHRPTLGSLGGGYL